jgi:hypothetical protein
MANDYTVLPNGMLLWKHLSLLSFGIYLLKWIIRRELKSISYFITS